MEIPEIILELYQTFGYGELKLWHKGVVKPDEVAQMVKSCIGEELTDEDLDRFWELNLVLLAMIFALEVGSHPHPLVISKFRDFVAQEM